MLDSPSSSSSSSSSVVMSASEYSASVEEWLRQAQQWQMMAVGEEETLFCLFDGICELKSKLNHWN